MSDITEPVKFHMSLNVAELDRAIRFYQVLFDRAPAKRRDNYAKFELEEPPVVFSLVPQTPGSGNSLSHLGLRVTDSAAIDAVRERLEAAGLGTQMQECTTCGYARQRKCWTVDPDGNHWEIYVVEEDVDPAAVRRSLEGSAARLERPAGPAVWEHVVTQPLPERLLHKDGTLDEVRLVGSFNVAALADRGALLVREAFRALKPGGKVLVHGLMADGPLTGMPPLTGLAALVSRVPWHAEPLQMLQEAGFAGLQFVKFADSPWLTHNGVGLREVKMIGWRPATDASTNRHVVYKGPFAEATDDQGKVYSRGQRVAVSAATWDLLRQGLAAEHFLFLDVQEQTGGGCRI
jgi:catechol 2,3-dioxygenase-like lactoylglutathione lyase family enzyme